MERVLEHLTLSLSFSLCRRISRQSEDRHRDLSHPRMAPRGANYRAVLAYGQCSRHSSSLCFPDLVFPCPAINHGEENEENIQTVRSRSTMATRGDFSFSFLIFFLSVSLFVNSIGNKEEEEKKRTGSETQIADV